MRYNFLNNFRYLCEAKAFVILMEKDVFQSLYPQNQKR
jgi:hypothetical protein